MLIEEGGKAVNGRGILQTEVPVIVQKVDEILSELNLVQGEDWDLVGSAGKKKEGDTSGDIDICIKISKMKELFGDDKKEMLNKLAEFLNSKGYDNSYN